MKLNIQQDKVLLLFQILLDHNLDEDRKILKDYIFYKGKKLDKEYYADFICYDKIIGEVKAISKLVNANKAQVINYLHGTKLLVGLLVNFGESSLKWERLTLLKNDKKE